MGICLAKIYSQPYGEMSISVGDCSVSGEIFEELKNDSNHYKTGDLYISKGKDLIFEWPAIIGPAVVTRKDSLLSIDCTGSLIHAIEDSLYFTRTTFAIVEVNLNSCSLNKAIQSDRRYLNEIPGGMLYQYDYIKKTYHSKRKILKNYTNENFIRVYSYCLMYHALAGDRRSYLLFNKLRKDYHLFDQGLDAVEFRFNKKMVDLLRPGKTKN
jgi:hypothetical protein